VSEEDAALLRERVRAALQTSTGKTLTQALKDAVPYGDHDLQLTSVDDPATLKIACGVRCRKCGWYFRIHVDLLVGARKAADSAVLEGTFYQLLRRFVTEVDQDCRTARLMAVVTDVHDL
jgi:hypothetical protein